MLARVKFLLSRLCQVRTTSKRGGLDKPYKSLENPKVPVSALSGMQHCYKIKLQQAVYHLVYLVEDDIVYITVIAMGKRNKSKVYEMAMLRLGGSHGKD